MAGKNKSNAWESVKFIKSHLPLWEEKGMTKSFLEDMIVPKYKKLSIDVESALSCDVFNFEAVYNQPDFISLLKAICKKHRLPYGKVKPEVEAKVENNVNAMFLDFEQSKLVNRMEKGEKELGFKGITEHLQGIQYIPVKVSNINEIVAELDEYRETAKKTGKNKGDLKLVHSADSIEIMMNLARENAGYPEIYRVARLGEKSIRRYYGMYQRLGLGKFSKNRNGAFKVNYRTVKFADGYIEEPKYKTTLFGE